jgi:hypothetical protein
MPPAKTATKKTTAKKTTAKKTAKKASAKKAATKVTKKAPAKKTTKKTTAKIAPAKKAAKKSGPKKMSTAHKAALAEGRRSTAVVDRYLSALHIPKRRGRQVSKQALQQRLSAAETQVRNATGVARLHAAQAARDLRARLDSITSTGVADVRKLERDFVRVAKRFSDRRGISLGAWRDAGVSSRVLQRAGISRKRSK